MSGIAANLGFTYQNKTLIFYLIDFLSKEKLLQCSFELQVDPLTEIDFHFLVRDEPKNWFYEAKNARRLGKSDIKKAVKNFYKFFLQNSSARFTLLHSCHPVGAIKNLYHESEQARKRGYIEGLVPGGSEAFADSVTSIHIPDGNSCGIPPGNLDFYTIHLIDEILRTKFDIEEYGAAFGILKTAHMTLQNLIRTEEQRLSDLRGVTGSSRCEVDLKFFFRQPDSFVSVIKNAKTGRTTEEAEQIFLLKTKIEADRGADDAAFREA